MHTFLATQIPELCSFPAPGYRPKQIYLITETVTPARSSEYEKASKKRATIAKKAAGKGFIVSKMGNGGNPNSYVMMFFFDSYAEGAKSAGTIQAALREGGFAGIPPGIVMSEERASYILLPGLSILPATQHAKQ